MKKYKLMFFTGLLMISILLMSCSKSDKQTHIETQANTITSLLLKGDFEQIHQKHLSKNLKDSLKETDLIKMWEEKVNSAGDYVEISKPNLFEKGKSYFIAEVEILFTNTTIDLRMTFDEKSLLAGLHITSHDKAVPPDGITEEEVTIGEGTPFELGGTLSLPKEYNDKLPAVVLVHGSGSSDRDESVYAYKPFQDIAWGLAEKGIAVLRYDKRTFVYGDEMPTNRFTVYEETVEDAVLAGNLLKNDSRIDSRKIYVIGHSLGGMLAPRIATEADIFSGIVSLAGSPRPLWEIIYDQNINYLDSLQNEDERDKQKQLIEQQYELAQQIGKMSAQEAAEKVVFGIPAYYFKEMDKYDPGQLALMLDLPFLIVQGEDDFQVSVQKDFEYWKNILQEKENVTFIRYSGLNHFFINYEGPNKGTVLEYQVPGSVELNVINDIAEWILEIAD